MKKFKTLRGFKIHEFRTSVNNFCFKHHMVIWTAPLDLNTDFWSTMWLSWAWNLHFLFWHFTKGSETTLKGSQGLNYNKKSRFKNSTGSLSLDYWNSLVVYLVYFCRVSKKSQGSFWKFFGLGLSWCTTDIWDTHPSSWMCTLGRKCKEGKYPSPWPWGGSHDREGFPMVESDFCFIAKARARSSAFADANWWL